MKKIICCFVAFIALQNIFAQQSFSGIRTGAYSGVHKLTNNPASIAGSQRKWDVNLFSFDINVTNDFIPISLNVEKTKENLENSDFLNNKDVSFATNLDLLGPSFFFNLNSKHAIGVTSHVRAMIDIQEDYSLFKSILLEDVDNIKNLPKIINVNNQYILSNAFSEVGISYAGVLFEKERHSVKIGATAKYVAGSFATYVGVSDLSGKLDYTDNRRRVELTTTGGVAETVFGGVDFLKGNFDVKDFTKFNATTVAFDFGVEYELKAKEDNSRYLLKLGASVTDIGKLKYTLDNNHSKRWTIPNNFTFDLSELGESFDKLEEIQKGEDLRGKEITSSLPTAFRLNADWRVFKGIYVDFSGQLGLTKKGKDSYNYNAYYRNTFTITPRIENRYFGLYLPVSNDSMSGTTLGTALRFGPLFVGSSTLLSSVFNKDSKSMNAFIGLRFGR